MNAQPAKTPDADRELAPLGSACLAARDVPTRVRIAPWGKVESTSGHFLVDEESARAVIEALQQHATDLPIDYEHQTLGGTFASPSGQAPAAGWIKGIEAEPGEGLFALVEWTAPAREQLAAKQYRYLSPVAVIRRSDRKMIGLHSAALTNKPAIVGAEPIVNRDDGGPPASAEDALSTLRNRLELDAGCDAEAVLLAASQRIEAMQQADAQRHAEQLVVDAARQGKITEAQRAFACRLALRDRELFDEWLRTAPVIVPLGRTQPPAGTTGLVGSEHARAAQARAEYHSHPGLAALTSEQAYVADALRRTC